MLRYIIKGICLCPLKNLIEKKKNKKKKTRKGTKKEPIRRLLEHFNNIRKTKLIRILSFRLCSFNFLGLENSNSPRRLCIKKQTSVLANVSA